MCSILGKGRLEDGVEQPHESLELARTVRLQISNGIAWMCRRDDDWRMDGTKTLVEFKSKQRVGQLGLCIGLKHWLISALALQIVEVELPA